MDVVSLCPLRVGSLLWQPRRGAWVLTAVCKATYVLTPAESPLAETQEYPNEEEGHWNDDPARSLYAPCDLVPFKPRADVTLVGHAFAPRKEPARSVVARLVVGDVSKAIEVWCDRVFRQDGALREGPRFVKMPLRYERAAGGPDTPNPVGMRLDVRPDAYGSVPVPNLQPPGLLPGSPKDFFETVCFGPIAWAWAPRRDRLGRHGAAWSEATWSQQPIPDDIDPGFFNAAPRDQQIEQLRPNERIVLENLHPEHARLATSLPGAQPRAFVERGGAAPQELSLICDTLWIDTDRGVCTLTWRAQIPLEHPRQPGRVLIAMAEPGQRISWSDVERLAAAAPAAKEAEPATPRGLHKGDPLVSTSHVEPAVARKAATLPFFPETDVLSVRAAPSEPSMRMGRPRVDTLTGVRDDVLPVAPSGLGGVPPHTPGPAGGLPFHGGTASLPNAPVTMGGTPMPPSAGASPPWLAQTRGGAQSPFAQAPPGSPFAGAPPPPFPELKPAPPQAPPPLPAPSPSPPPFAVAQQAPAAPPLTVGQQAAPPPLVAGPALVTPSGLAPAAGPGGAPVNLGPIAAAASAPSTPAMVSTAVAATVGVVAVSNAAAASARAAAQAQANQPPQAAAHRATGTRPREVIDLLWFDKDALPRVRAAWKELLESVKADPEKKDAKKKGDLGFDDDDDAPPPDPPEISDRRDVSTVMARGELLEPDWVHDAIAGAVEGDGSFLPPLILTGGELLFPFDELETLKATMTVVSPLVGADKKLKETVDSVNELLQNKALESSAGVAEGLTARVKEAFGAQGRMLPASYLDTTTERVLLEQRRYQKRTVFGAPWVRAELSTSGNNPVPAYLPDELASRLPMFQRFRAKIIAEAHLSQDQYEASPSALKVVAVARVMPVGIGARGERRA